MQLEFLLVLLLPLYGYGDISDFLVVTAVSWVANSDAHYLIKALVVCVIPILVSGFLSNHGMCHFGGGFL